MYTFIEEDGVFKIHEFDGIDCKKIIATFDSKDEAEDTYEDLKEGCGFDGHTPNFFGIVHFSVDN